MTFTLQTFKIRALTAVLFVAVMLAGLLISQWSFFLLFSVIHFGCWKEYQKLVGLINKDYQQISSLHKYGVMLLGWCYMIWMWHNPYRLGNTTLSGLGWYCMLLLAVLLLAIEVVTKKQLRVKLIAYSLFGLLYISLSWALMMSLRNSFPAFAGSGLVTYNPGLIIILMLVVSIWINDTMAYIVGSFIGKTPLSNISPKKTLEGTIGGAILAVITVTLISYFAIGLNYMVAIIISSIASIMGTLGDLLESKIKRMAGVKDSGQIMPGHGGFLDRFDSLLLATPIVWLYLKLFL